MTPTSIFPPATIRTNTLSVSKSDSVTGSFIIDPALGAAPQADVSRPNLRLVSIQSSVEADVWVLGHRSTSATRTSSLTFMDFVARGLVSTRFHSFGQGQCNVNAYSVHGDVVVAIPRDYVGIIRTSSRHKPVIPRLFSALSETRAEGVYLAGDWTGTGWDGAMAIVHIIAPRGKITVKVEEAPGYSVIYASASGFGLIMLAVLVLPWPPTWAQWVLVVVAMCRLLFSSDWSDGPAPCTSPVAPGSIPAAYTPPRDTGRESPAAALAADDFDPSLPGVSYASPATGIYSSPSRRRSPEEESAIRLALVAAFASRDEGPIGQSPVDPWYFQGTSGDLEPMFNLDAESDWTGSHSVAPALGERLPSASRMDDAEGSLDGPPVLAVAGSRN